MTINPKDAAPGRAYEVAYGGERQVAILTNDDRLPWVVSVTACCDDDENWVWAENDDVSDLVPLVPARNVTRADLPPWGEVATLVEQAPWDTSTVDVVLDAVVAHLNERGGVPAEVLENPEKSEKSCCEEAQLTANELARRNEELSKKQEEIAALTKALGEANDARAEWADKCKEVRRLRHSAEAKRDEWEAKYWDMRGDRNVENGKRLAAESARADLEAERDVLQDRVERAETGQANWELNYWRSQGVCEELQAKLVEAENRPTLNREAVREVISKHCGALGGYYMGLLEDDLMALAPAAEYRPEVKRVGDGWLVNGAYYPDSPTLDREAVEDILYPRLNMGHFVDPEETVDAIMALVPAAEDWPDWLGPKINHDDYDPERIGGVAFRVDGRVVTADSAEVARKSAKDYLRVAASYAAVARFIESEQAATGDEDQRVEELTGLLTGTTDDHQRSISPRLARILAEAVARAGWTPPESEETE